MCNSILMRVWAHVHECPGAKSLENVKTVYTEKFVTFILQNHKRGVKMVSLPKFIADIDQYQTITLIIAL